ncbi:nucleolar protein 7 [Betta splendens]|uniref:Nucleolar protein 7 n=1 Tax=Betta splendens TaxID=158456 RepID=A0A6P7L2C4_BETSP|nr:nucleolar protein 7 [Betta splendens]
MAKKQRGEKSLQSKKADREKRTNEFKLELDSSDDEAPDEVTFENSKTQALQSRKEALDRARREKELLKDKRRKRQELFQEQKKRKLLPADVLEEVASAPSKKQRPSTDEEDKQLQKKKRKLRKSLKHRRVVKGNYTVMLVKERVESHQQQSARDFVQSRLYGPGSHRSTNNELLSLENKTGKNKGAAMQFVKVDWASKKKAKAEKEKKRWIHKQQILSC